MTEIDNRNGSSDIEDKLVNQFRNSLGAAKSNGELVELRDLLQKGTLMTKYPNKLTSKAQERLVKIVFPSTLSWESKKKTNSTGNVNFDR
jgi:hypothetical protein